MSVTQFRKFRTRLVAAFAAIMVAVLASCGGSGVSYSGGSTAGVGSGGTGGQAAGTVTGFGSVIVDGVSYDVSSTGYQVPTEQAESATASATDVKLGQQVQIDHDADDKASNVTVVPQLVGKVTALASDGFTVNTVTVKVNADSTLGPVTVYDGYSGLSDVAVGDRVEVHGTVAVDASANTYVQATRVEQKIATAFSSQAVRATGTISAYDSTAKTFTLAGLTVKFSTSTTILPSGTTLSNGQVVNVWSSSALSGSTLTANVIRVRNVVSSSAATLQIGGPITSYVSASNFVVAGITVNASAASLAPANQSLAKGVYVRVIGTFNTSTNTLVASSLTLYSLTEIDCSLHGTIDNYVSTASFSVRGVTVDASGAAFVGGTAASLANGVYVEIEGQVQNNSVVATTVTIKSTTPDGSTVDAVGKISNFNSTSGTFTLSRDNGTALSTTLGRNVVYNNGNASSLGNDVYVLVEGSYSGSVLTANSITFRPTPPVAGLKSIEGVAFNVTATSFSLRGLTILINGVTPTGGSLVNGAHVEVYVTVQGNSLVASKIQIEN